MADKTAQQGPATTSKRENECKECKMNAKWVQNESEKSLKIVRIGRRMSSKWREVK